nr:phage major capsid protein [Lactobacillus sp.]
GDQLQSIIDELDELKAQLDELDELEEEEAERSFNPFKNSVELRNGNVMFSTGGAVKSDDLALRSGESMVSRCSDQSGKKLDLGKYVRGIVTGNWDNATEERSAMTTGSLGAVIPEVLSAKIIDYARNISLFGSANVPVYPMTSNNLTIGRVANDPVFKFKAESAKGDEVSFSLDSVELNSKTAYGYAYVSLEAINSARNLTQILYRVFGQAIANAIDKGLLYGQYNATTSSYDTFAPAGIMNDTDVEEINATGNVYNDIIKAIGAVKRNNGTPTVLGVNAVTDELMNLFADDTGAYQKAPESVSKLTQIVTNQLAYDETTGSDALVFDPEAIAIGIQKNIVVRMITDSDYCIENGMVGFQIYAMLDGKAVRPTHIAKITGIGVEADTE